MAQGTFDLINDDGTLTGESQTVNSEDVDSVTRHSPTTSRINFANGDFILVNATVNQVMDKLWPGPSGS